MKAFVTSGTDFTSRHLVRLLRNRGYDVYGLAETRRDAQVLQTLGAHAVPGSITDADSMREAMAGSDVVFHTASWHDEGPAGRSQAETVNVSGTRTVLELAHELGVPRIIYTSSVAIYGDTEGELVAESYTPAGPPANEFGRTKWLAHHEVVLPLIKQGAPITIVLPGVVYGPGVSGWLASLMRLFYRGLLPVVPAPETTLTYAYVEDVAEGHILAAEKGAVGESYILAGPAISLGELVEFWAHLTGKRAPAGGVSAGVVQGVAPAVGRAQPLFSLAPVLTEEVLSVLGSTNIARSDKARAQLGWQTRAIQSGMTETFEWIAASEPVEPLEREKRMATITLVAGAALFLWWLLRRRSGPDSDEA